MEKLLNHYDKECMKMAMLKHEETFRGQVYELHRLYQIQKLLMKEIAKSPTNYRSASSRKLVQPELQQFNVLESGGTVAAAAAKCRSVVITEIDGHDHLMNSDLELTLGPKKYYTKKVVSKACEHATDQSDSGPSFSSSSTGSCHVAMGRRNTRRSDHYELQKKLPGPEIMASNNNNSNNQDRLNSSPPWIFQALSLNMT
ncbi:hypothetical protein ABFS82_08G056600 [Erythranthe guttata]|uniref:Uncharacterized protein n=1 Tax=Erythranthe guttata TaxID=4155 RepID=A0A022RX05_ERYGU|nr:PREDICTED: uncharacterized protein LOC105975723 [Erythranthe guttata]EYU44475.1 hypothetical protein MIMGU_mgv1a014138mg [Erythranthe guttata]EYU44476.1 hypothetical protein MIMGU_mgv1a014138mg [Erythranthe guttata]|eukprot:XP_012856396.1 PREDICTED: uncharacterized protein LOC105975723 [Erythranthe guttata]